MKRILNTNILLIIVVLFVIFNIMHFEYNKIKTYLYQRNLLEDCVVINFKSNNALAKNKIVLINKNPKVLPYYNGDTIMIPLEFFLKNIDEAYEYKKDDNGINIVYKNKELQWRNNSNIYISEEKNNKVYKYNYESAEVIDSVVYVSLENISSFFDRIVYKRGNNVIISKSNNSKKINEIDLDRVGKLLITKKHS